MEGVPYFQLEHKRRDDDKMTGPAPWKKGSQNSIYFELSSDRIEGATTIKSLGLGNISDKDEKFYPASKEWGYDPSLPGYLTADYSTDPPWVKLEKQPGKYSTWKISRAEQEGRWYIENDNRIGKHAWLVPESKPVFVYPGGGRQEFTVEYYRAVLSESKHAFKIGMANQPDR